MDSVGHTLSGSIVSKELCALHVDVAIEDKDAEFELFLNFFLHDSSRYNFL